jgi:hypothetical protein
MVMLRRLCHATFKRRRHVAFLYTVSYLAAAMITCCVLFLTGTWVWEWDGDPMILALPAALLLFPAGLLLWATVWADGAGQFATVLGLSAIVGYVVFVWLFIAGIASRRRWIFYLFTTVLLTTMGGCIVGLRGC